MLAPSLSHFRPDARVLGYADRVNTPLLQGRTAAVITASDRCAAGVQEDLSGPAVAKLLEIRGIDRVERLVVRDDLSALIRALREAADRVDLVITTGGTGLSSRDNTPEATLAVCDRLVPGLAELMRREGMAETPFAALSRAVCGISGRALILNLPGSPRGAESSLRVVLPLLPHALALLAGKTAHHE